MVGAQNHLSIEPSIPTSHDVRATLHIVQVTSKNEQRRLNKHALRGNDIAYRLEAALGEFRSVETVLDRPGESE